MVVFTCQHCNAALKKPEVEKHVSTKCRRNPYLTCVDCLNDFRGDEYKTHTTCISEDQRYGGKDFKAKPVAVKQNSWMEVVQECINKHDGPKYFLLFQKLKNNNNIPRKKQKFLNYVSNALNWKNLPLAEQVFDLFQKEFENSIKKTVNKNGGIPSPGKNGDVSDNLENQKLGSDNKKETKGDDNVVEPSDGINIGKKKDKSKFVEPDSSESIKKRNHISESDSVDASTASDNAKVSKKNKKKIKTSSPNEVTGSIEEHSQEHVNSEDASSSKDKKKKKKNKNKLVDGKENIDVSLDGQADQCENEETEQLENGEALEKGKCDSEEVNGNEGNVKLSKKELKKLKKKQKYEAELKQIVDEKNNPASEEVDAPERDVETKSKKKRKATASMSETDENKKQKVEVSKEEEEEEEPVLQEVPPNPKAKFDWEQMIRTVLEKHDDDMSMKRLSKKIFTEYQATRGDQCSYEDFMSKFNKKVLRVPGVKVLKDKARLIQKGKEE